MELAPDFDEFIACLSARGVDFPIVGAYALAFHGVPRFTGDLDILIKPSVDNGSRLLQAIGDFGFPTGGLTASDLADPRRLLEMGVPPVQLHVMSAISGAAHSTMRPGWVAALTGPEPCAETPTAATSVATTHAPANLTPISRSLPGPGG